MSTGEERVQKFMNDGQDLKEMLQHYNWQYRKKICTKCPIEQQALRKCFRVDNYKTINGVKIQETHCDWMNRARTRKFHDKILNFIGIRLQDNSSVSEKK